MVHRILDLIRVCLAFVCACKPDGTRDVIRRPRPPPAQTLITDEEEEDETGEDVN